MTELNTELLRKLSPGWTETLLKPLGYKERYALRGDEAKCLLGCFWGYTGNYFKSWEPSFCEVCRDLSIDVADTIADLEHREVVVYDETAIISLDEQAINELNTIGEKLYAHAKEKHPERIR